MPKGAWISYGDVAPEAKENFTPTASEDLFNRASQLKQNMTLYNYANPCERYQTLLDGTPYRLPQGSKNTGLWSKQLSNEDGTFDTPITLTLESAGQYSSQGFTFTFDKFNDIYPRKLKIEWYRVTSTGTEDLADGGIEFEPNSSFFFCRNQVENYNKVVITFYNLNMPKNRLKVACIDYGYGTVFQGSELRNVKIAQYIDPISSEIKINTCDFTLDSHTDMEYSFQAKQPLTVGFNDRTLGTAFVKTAKRKARFLWDVNGEDQISIMESTPFAGGIYTNVAATTILSDIFTTAKVSYKVQSNILSGKKLTGYIPYTTCREALMQVCFACGVVADTANEKNSGVVYIRSLESDVKQTIPLNRIMTGQNFENGNTVTKVELTAHTYKAIDETLEAYKAEDSGTGTNIFVKFSEPLHTLKIGYIDTSGDDDKFVESASYGKILSSGANYAYINATNAKCVLSGGRYEHTTQTKSKQNEKVLASEKDNVMSITSATLISPSNITEALTRAYNWLTRVDKTNVKIIEGKDVTREIKSVKWGEKAWGTFKWGERYVEETSTEHKPINLGDNITVETEYLGNVTGRVIQQSFNLNGNIIVKEVVLQ